MKFNPVKWLPPALLSVLALLFDYLSKNWANSNLTYGEPREFLPSLLHFALTRNTGGAFGIGRGHGLFMLILASSIVIGIIYWMYQRESSETPPNNLERAGVGLIVGGALGNLLDRLTRGEVTDFLAFSFMDFPVFNVADALIDAGAVLVVLGTVLASKNTKSIQDLAENERESKD